MTYVMLPNEANQKNQPKPKMYFRLVSKISEGITVYGLPSTLQIPTSPPIRISLEAYGDGDLSVYCVATSARRLRPEHLHEFNRLTAAMTPFISSDLTVEPSGAERRSAAISWSSLPKGTQSLINQLESDLRTGSENTVQILRWRMGIREPREAFERLGLLQWSIDGEVWFFSPFQPRFISLSMTMKSVGSEQEADTQALLDRQTFLHPLGHDLLREARDMVLTSPRSALVTAISAAEAGVKSFIVGCDPSYKEVFENTQAEPLEDLLTKTIPAVSPRKALCPDQPLIPNDLVAALRKSIFARNRTVHGERQSIEIEFANETIESVENLLWLLDYYYGFDWAEQHLPDSFAMPSIASFEDDLPAKRTSGFTSGENHD